MRNTKQGMKLLLMGVALVAGVVLSLQVVAGTARSPSGDHYFSVNVLSNSASAELFSFSWDTNCTAPDDAANVMYTTGGQMRDELIQTRRVSGTFNAHINQPVTNLTIWVICGSETIDYSQNL